jgi:hypothetical protein
VAQPVTKSKTRAGNAALFIIAIVFVGLCVAGGIFFLIPGLYHPFTSDSATDTYAHFKPAVALFALALLGLIVVRATRPASRDLTAPPS